MFYFDFYGKSLIYFSIISNVAERRTQAEKYAAHPDRTHHNCRKRRAVLMDCISINAGTESDECEINGVARAFSYFGEQRRAI